MPLPDFIELLDELRLPKVRQNNYVIGIWILVRGKLVPPPAPLTAPPVPNVAPSQPQPSISTPILPAALQAYPQLANTALAAEVAALTPEQIQAILRTLSSGNGGIPSISGGLATAVANVAHPHPPVPPTPWPGGVGFPASATPAVPGPSPTFPAPPPHSAAAPSFMSPHTRTPPQPGMSPHAPPGMHPPPAGPRGFGPRFDREEPDARYRDERGDRPGGWQNGRGRGRGRSRGRSGSGDFVGRPVDAGWARHRGGAPPAQDDRVRWDGPSPPRRWG